MTYQLIQDAQQATALGARAQRVLNTQSRVAKLSAELRLAVMDYEAALAAYETTPRPVSGSTEGWREFPEPVYIAPLAHTDRSTTP